MGLELHLHPLSSFCWKVLIALYEAGTPFTPVMVDLGDPATRTAYLQISPFGKIPALRDLGRGVTVYETGITIDYLDQYYPGSARLIPDDRDAAREVRLRERIFDLYVHDPMQRIVADRLRPQGKGDPMGVEAARAQLRASYEVLERELAGRSWAAGEAFSLADCAAFPALFYADVLEPIGAARPWLAGYLQRLRQRPSAARAAAEAQPCFQYFPGTEEERKRLPKAA